ncbi:MAG: DUF58 domain-containing protein [Zavarzinella sp.]
MLTKRGRNLLFFLLLFLFFGIIMTKKFGYGLFLIASISLGWFLLEWLQFLFQAVYVLPRLRIKRTIQDGDHHLPVLWSNLECDVVITINGASGHLPHLQVEEIVPQTLTIVDGKPVQLAALPKGGTFFLTYRVKHEAPGVMHFEGIRLKVIDHQGFFYRKKFHREPVEYLVLPRLAGYESNQRTGKRHNIFPPPGMHRLHRPGGGSELLDLRDYIPGDPPKTIAWKPSARKDKLITKEFETEIPLRVTLFLDASDAMRVGHPKKLPIHRLANLGTAVAEAANLRRDHVGLVTFHADGHAVVRPGRSRTHLMDLLRILAKMCGQTTPTSTVNDASLLAKFAYPVACDLYPDLMDPANNTLPRGMFWKPISDSNLRWVALLLLTPSVFMFFWLVTVFVTFSIDQVGPTIWTLKTLLPLFKDMGILGTLKLFAVISGIGNISAFLLWFVYGLTGFLQSHRTPLIYRKQLALLFAQLDQAPAGTELQYQWNDELFARRASRFLTDHRVRHPIRLHDDEGNYLYYQPSKLDHLCEQLNRAVGLARDNELFVIVVDLLEYGSNLSKLIKSVQVAIARRHQVIIIQPWSADIDLPQKQMSKQLPIPAEPALKYERYGLEAIHEQVMQDIDDLSSIAYVRVVRELGRVGATVVRADETEPIHLILTRLEKLRSGGRKW